MRSECTGPPEAVKVGRHVMERLALAVQALLCADVLPTGWFCAERAGINELLRDQGEVVVAVVGCGPIGLAAIAAALSMQATKVYAFL